MYFKLYNKNINYFIYHLTFPVLDMLNLTSTTFSHYKKKKNKKSNHFYDLWKKNIKSYKNFNTLHNVIKHET